MRSRENKFLNITLNISLPLISYLQPTGARRHRGLSIKYIEANLLRQSPGSRKIENRSKGKQKIQVR